MKRYCIGLVSNAFTVLNKSHESGAPVVRISRSEKTLEDRNAFIRNREPIQKVLDYTADRCLDVAAAISANIASWLHS